MSKALEPELRLAIDLRNSGGHKNTEAARTIENQYLELRRLAEVNADLLEELVSARDTLAKLQGAMTGPFFQEQLDKMDAAIKKATDE